MISCGPSIRRYCSEPLSNIENYKEAVKSPFKYVIHHRKEDDGYSVKELRQMGLYWHRPAAELIFMERREHIKHHNTGNRNLFYGVLQEDHPAFINIDEHELAIEDSKHKSYRELARHFGVSSQTIRRRLKKLGLHVRGGHDNVHSRYHSDSKEVC